MIAAAVLWLRAPPASQRPRRAGRAGQDFRRSRPDPLPRHATLLARAGQAPLGGEDIETFAHRVCVGAFANPDFEEFCHRLALSRYARVPLRPPIWKPACAPIAASAPLCAGASGCALICIAPCTAWGYQGHSVAAATRRAPGPAGNRRGFWTVIPQRRRKAGVCAAGNAIWAAPERRESLQTQKLSGQNRKQRTFCLPRCICQALRECQIQLQGGELRHLAEFLRRICRAWGTTNSVARRRTLPLGGNSPVHLPSPAGTTNCSRKATNFALGEISPVHVAKSCGNVKFSCQAANFATWRNFPGALAKPCGTPNSVARRRTLPLGEISSVHLPSPAERQIQLQGGELYHLAKFPQCICQAMWECQIQSRRQSHGQPAFMQDYLEVFLLVADVLIALAACWRCQHPETARAALPARRLPLPKDGRIFAGKRFTEGAQNAVIQSGGCKKRFEPSLVCRLPGNAALLPGEQATPFGPFPGLAASKRPYLRGILQTLPVTAFQAQARIYGGRLQKREIPRRILKKTGGFPL